MLIVAGLVAVALIYRGTKMKGMKFRGGGISAEMSTHEPPMQEIKGNVLKGEKNAILTERDDMNIRDNTLQGKNQKIQAKNPKR